MHRHTILVISLWNHNTYNLDFNAPTRRLPTIKVNACSIDICFLDISMTCS